MLTFVFACNNFIPCIDKASSTFGEGYGEAFAVF